MIIASLKNSLYFTWSQKLKARRIQEYGKNKYGHLLPELMFVTDGHLVERRVELACKAAFARSEFERSDRDVELIAALTKHRSELKSAYYSGWPEYQVKDLCRHMRLETFKPEERIYDAGGLATKAYLVVRGMVSILRVDYKMKSGARKSMVDHKRGTFSSTEIASFKSFKGGVQQVSLK